MRKGQVIKLIVMITIGAVVIYNLVLLIKPNIPEVEPEAQITIPIFILTEEKEKPQPKEKEPIEVINVIINTPPAEAKPAPQPIVIPPPVVEVIVQTQPAPELLVTAPSMREIKIISPMSNKGLGRVYTAQPEIVDETNYIELGLIIRNDSGDIVKDAEVTITGTDTEQNKTLNGTGNITKIYKDGVPESVHYYPFHYEFKTVGTHTITFTANGYQEVSIDLVVTEEDPA